MPKSITKLNLSTNNMSLQTTIELTQFFAAIPANVTSLNLRTNSFQLENEHDWNSLFHTLPETLDELILDKTSDPVIEPVIKTAQIKASTDIKEATGLNGGITGIVLDYAISSPYSWWKQCRKEKPTQKLGKDDDSVSSLTNPPSLDTVSLR